MDCIFFQAMPNHKTIVALGCEPVPPRRARPIQKETP